ncbi:AAA family ATPase [Streptosporangium sp. NPDC023615]|uniref:AAA family ATPase n=1 Tax=Streptosporangium sp. NPDC023615 TaxID=3154794 RepID=UPI003418D309
MSGVRGFSGAREVNLAFARPDRTYAGWTVLAGRNGAGKTTLLQAIGLAMSGSWLMPGADVEAWADPPSGDQPRTVSVTVVPDEHLDDAGLFTGLQSSVTMTTHWHPDHGVRRETDDGLSGPPIGGHGGRGGRGWLCVGYGPFRRLSGGSPIRRGHDRRGRHDGGMSTLFDEDAALTEGVDWLIEQHLLQLEKKPGAGSLLENVLTLLSDGLLPDDHRIRRVDSDGLWVDRRGEEVPLRRMSDGYRAVTALVLDIVRQMYLAYGGLGLGQVNRAPALTYPGVVLIDEMDAHLHVSWQQKIGEWLKAHFPRIQFIVTTHSPYVCQSASPGGLIRLPGPDEEDSARVVDEDLYRRIVYGSGDDAVVTELFGVDSAYSPRSDELREDLGDLEVKVLDGDATPAEIEEYERISRTPASSPATRVREVSQPLGPDS